MISFQYFDGCPNAAATLENLRSVASDLGIPADQIAEVEVNSVDEAETLGFAGSPSVIVDGVDIYTGTATESASFSCRVFTFGGKQTGVIPEWFLREKLSAR